MTSLESQNARVDGAHVRPSKGLTSHVFCEALTGMYLGYEKE